MDSYPVPRPSLHRTCSALAIKVHDLVTIAGLRADDETASQLACQLGELENATKNLAEKLAGTSLVVPRFTAETVQSTLSAGDDIISGIGNYVRPCISGPLHAAWDGRVVRDCGRMLGTQAEMLGLLVGVLGLSNPGEQDARLESNEAFKLRCRVLQDAQTVRETAAVRAGAQSLPFGPAPLCFGQEGLEVVTEGHATRSTSNQTSPPASSLHQQRGASAVDDASIKSIRSTSNARRPNLSKFLSAVGIKQGGGPASDPKYLASQLCQACRDGDLEWAKAHIERGADVNGLDSKYSPPLYYAVVRGELGIAKLLVENGARVGGHDGQSSAMVLYAVWKKDIPVLTYLLEHSAPVTASCWDPRDRNRRTTPLGLAVETGNVKAVRLLLDHGADVHGGEKTGKSLDPLCTAVDRRHAEVVKLLLSYQARLNGTASSAAWASGLAPLHVAAYRGHADILDILLKAGADVNVTCQRGGASGVTALHLATGSCAAMLIQRGANILTGDSLNQYPLSGAVQVRDITSVRTLLQHGAPVNAADCRNDTALHIACKLFANDARAGDPQHLATYRAIAGELLSWKASVGSRSGAHITIRDTCKKLLQTQRPPVDGPRLELMELMSRIIEIVEARATRPATPPGTAREILENLVWTSALAQLVNKPPA